MNVGPLMGADDLAAVINLTNPRVAIGLDLQAPMLMQAGRHLSVEHWVWVTLQGYQNVLRRLGYQIKLWQEPGVFRAIGQLNTQLRAPGGCRPAGNADDRAG